MQKCSTTGRLLKRAVLHTKKIEIGTLAEILSTVLTNKIIAKLGYASMLDHYLKVCEN